MPTHDERDVYDPPRCPRCREIRCTGAETGNWTDCDMFDPRDEEDQGDGSNHHMRADE